MDDAGAPLQFPFSTMVESSTLSIVSHSNTKESLHYLVSIGGYGDDDDLLGGHFLPICVQESNQNSLKLTQNETIQVQALQHWKVIEDDNSVFISFSGKCLKCSYSDTIKRENFVESSTDSDFNSMRFVKLEGHTSATITSSDLPNLCCGCSRKTVIEECIREKVKSKSVRGEAYTCDFTDPIILFGGQNEDYEKNASAHILQIVTVKCAGTFRSAPQPMTFFLVDKHLPNFGSVPPPVYRHSAAYHTNHLYVFGGDSDAEHTENETVDSVFYRYNIKTSLWEMLPSPFDSVVAFHGRAKLIESNNISRRKKHALSTLSVLDDATLVLLGGYDFDDSSIEKPSASYAKQESILVSLFQRCQSFFYCFRKALRFETRPVPMCASFSIDDRKWSPLFSKPSSSDPPFTNVNGHVAFNCYTLFTSSVYWCAGKKNASQSDSMSYAHSKILFETSNEIDDAFTGDQHGELYCLYRERTTSMKSIMQRLQSWLLGSNLMNVYRYVVYRVTKLGKCIPQGLYMPAGCNLDVTKINRNFSEENSQSIFFVMGGNRRHPDEMQGNVCWFYVNNAGQT